MCPAMPQGRAMAHSVPSSRTRKGPAWSFAGVGRRVLQLEVPEVTLTPLGHLLFQIAGEGWPSSITWLPWHRCAGSSRAGTRGSVHSFPQRSLVHSFLIHSFPHSHRTPFTAPRHSCSHGFIHSPASRHPLRGSQSARGSPRPQACPSVPRPVRPAWALRGEPRNQPRLRGARAGGEPGWGQGAGAPCGKPGGLGEPRPRHRLRRARPRRRVRARGRQRQRQRDPSAAAAAAAAAQASRAVAQGHVDGRPAARPAPPGGDAASPEAGRGRGRRRRGGRHPRGSAVSAAQPAARVPPPARGRQSGLCSPASGAPSGAAARVGAWGGPNHERFAGRGGHSQGARAGTRRAPPCPPRRPARAPGTELRGPRPP